MNDFADSDPQFWLDDSRVLVVRSLKAQTPRARGMVAQARNILSAALFGLSVIGLTSLSVSSSDHIVHSSQVANERADNGLSRRYWAGLARALEQAPAVAAYDDSDEPAPLL